MAFPKIHHPSSELPGPKGVGNGDPPEWKLLAVIGRGAHEMSFPPCSLSLEDIFGEDLAFWGIPLKYTERGS